MELASNICIVDATISMQMAIPSEQLVLKMVKPVTITWLTASIASLN